MERPHATARLFSSNQNPSMMTDWADSVGLVSQSNFAIGSFPPTVYNAVPSRDRAVTETTV
jgi:hypothetical protein